MLKKIEFNLADSKFRRKKSTTLLVNESQKFILSCLIIECKDLFDRCNTLPYTVMSHKNAFQLYANHPLAENMGYMNFEGM